MLNPYPLTEADDLSYLFTTGQQIEYHIFFLDYSYMFADYPRIAGNIYSFNIYVPEGDNNIASFDERIGVTIVEVFKTFFKRIENVAVYVCDNADERHMARKRKFDFWFWKYNDGSIVKEDGIAMAGNMEIINSLLVHTNNPHLSELIFAFKDLNSKAGDK
ncbi:MAG: DUF6169 family protein [Ginsengibacter sp.]